MARKKELPKGILNNIESDKLEQISGGQDRDTTRLWSSMDGTTDTAYIVHGKNSSDPDNQDYAWNVYTVMRLGGPSQTVVYDPAAACSLILKGSYSTEEEALDRTRKMGFEKPITWELEVPLSYLNRRDGIRWLRK